MKTSKRKDAGGSSNFSKYLANVVVTAGVNKVTRLISKYNCINIILSNPSPWWVHSTAQDQHLYNNIFRVFFQNMYITGPFNQKLYIVYMSRGYDL